MVEAFRDVGVANTARRRLDPGERWRHKRSQFDASLLLLSSRAMPIGPSTLTPAALLSSVRASVAKTFGGVHAIILLDLLPDRQGEGARLLVDFVKQAGQDQTVRSIVLIQQSHARSITSST